MGKKRRNSNSNGNDVNGATVSFAKLVIAVAIGFFIIYVAVAILPMLIK